MRGFLITFEGPDGSGKTTQAGLLAEYLEQRRHRVLLTREPGGTGLGEQVRTLLLDVAYRGMDPRTEVLLYAADRAEHVAKVIVPAINDGVIILCDRFVDSTLAYQAAGRELDMQEVVAVNRWATGGLWPDLTLLLDLEPQAGLRRARGRSGDSPDRLEGEEMTFHRRVRAGFLELARREPERIHLIGADKLATSVFAEVKAVVNQKMRMWLGEA